MGIILLCLLIAGSILVRFVLISRQSSEVKITVTPLFSDSQTITKSVSQKSPMIRNNPDKQFTPFDPNVVSETELFGMPFSKNQIRALLKYRTAGGKFFKKKDLLKIYHMDSGTYRLVYPYIILPGDGESVQFKFSQNSVEKKPKALINLNTADSAELEALPGIGAYLASQIVRYRKRLGGYIAQEQLLEIKNFRAETLAQISSGIQIIPCENCKLNVNTADVKQLGLHPYIGFGLGGRIVQYRSQHGTFQHINDLMKVAGMTPEIMDKVYNHLKVE